MLFFLQTALFVSKKSESCTQCTFMVFHTVRWS